MSDKAIEMQNVSFVYKGSEEEVLQDINLTVEEGKFTVIMGRTGAGKTTLAMLPNGIIPQLVEGTVKGTVIAASKDTSKFRVQTLAKEVGLVLQDPETQIFGRTVEEDTAFGPRNYLIPRKEILERIKIALSKVRLDGYEKRDTSQLSGGEKQRLAIAGILAKKKYIPESAGTLKTDTVTFGVMTFAVIFIVAALSFFPVHALSTIAEHLTL